ncbi:Rz1-like lysis system protein LysC [Limnobaculum xujianqingii]
MLLSGCENTRIVYVPVQPAPIPVNLTADCSVPEISDHMSWGDSLSLNIALLAELGKCNQDKAGIRKIESSRQR